MLKRIALSLILVAAALTGVARAQAWAAQDRPPLPPGEQMAPGPPEEEDEELQETIEIYMIARMKRSLGLSRDQEEKIVPLVQELSDARRRHLRERRLVMMKLRILVEDSRSEDEEIRRTLGRLDSDERTYRDNEARLEAGVRSALSLRQQAQFLLFRDLFRRDLMQRMRRGPGGPPGGQPEDWGPRGPRRPGPGRPGPAGGPGERMR